MIEKMYTVYMQLIPQNLTICKGMRAYTTWIWNQICKTLLFWYIPSCFSISQKNEIHCPTQHFNAI